MSYMPIIKTIMTSLFKKTATVAYPYKPMYKDPLVRGSVGLEVDKCIFCGICTRKCPTGAIVTDKNEKVWEISQHGCIVCGACVEACPKKCMHMKPELTPASNTLVKSKVTAGA